MPRFRYPTKSPYVSDPLPEQRGYLSDAAAYKLLWIVAIFALLLFLLLTLHPQGFPLIPWLIDHL